MASTSSEPGMKSETVGGGGGGGGGEASEIGQRDQQVLMMYRGVKKAKKERGCTAKERISKMPPCAAGKRSSIYRGVTRHRWTGRYEAHLWDKSTWNQNQNKKGKQVYLGAYDDEEAAARAYDLAALKYWGPGTLINFPVTDYTRDLEEMQHLSREDYLASLRRKSSGFSRGISKYRGLSSRWESSYGRIGGAEYFSSIHYGTCEDPSVAGDFGGTFPIDRKIDLTSCIKWWRPNKSRQTDSAAKSYEETKQGSEDISSELKTDWAMHPTEPYQMPRLGGSRENRKHKGSALSALQILSQSAAYKNMEEKVSKKQEKDIDNEDNENKNNINRMDHGKIVEKSASHDCTSDREGASVAISAGLSLQRNIYPFTSLLNAPLLTNYNAIDTLVDPVLWTSLVPIHPAGLPRAAEVPKSETSSTYTFNQPTE